MIYQPLIYSVQEAVDQLLTLANEMSNATFKILIDTRHNLTAAQNSLNGLETSINGPLPFAVYDLSIRRVFESRDLESAAKRNYETSREIESRAAHVYREFMSEKL